MSTAGRLVALTTAALAGACATPSFDREALGSLVEAERAFARMAVEQDVRSAFVANLADDGILFRPGPVRARDWFASQPLPADPKAVLLEWEPAVSGIAASGEFGYTSGPVRASLRAGGKPPAYFVYFSVWKREAAGRWRVAIDAGTSVPEMVAVGDLAPGPASGRVRGASDGRSLETLSGLERSRPLDGASYASHVAEDALLLRDGMAPVKGEAAKREMRADLAVRSLEPIGGDIARSGDMAYSYGRWRDGEANGHYVHLWIRGARGDWRIAVALRLAA